MTSINMRKDNVPSSLWPYIELAARWGIPDDGYRDEAVHQASTEELINFVKQVNGMDEDALDNWLVGPEADSDNPSEEYVAFTCLLMAYDLAKVLLERAGGRDKP